MLITQTECLKISVALINAQFIFMGLCLVFLLLLKLNTNACRPLICPNSNFNCIIGRYR